MTDIAMALDADVDCALVLTRGEHPGRRGRSPAAPEPTYVLDRVDELLRSVPADWADG